MLEQFKNSFLEMSAMIIMREEVNVVAKVAVLAHDFLLTYKRGIGDFPAFADLVRNVSS